jgi:hypothetical protein
MVGYPFPFLAKIRSLCSYYLTPSAWQPHYDQIFLFGDSITEFAECQDRGFGFAAALRDGKFPGPSPFLSYRFSIFPSVRLSFSLTVIGFISLDFSSFASLLLGNVSQLLENCTDLS